MTHMPSDKQDDHEPIVIDGDALHDAAIGLDNGYWYCKLCRARATSMKEPRGYGVFHREDCFLVKQGVIRNRNERKVGHAVAS